MKEKRCCDCKKWEATKGNFGLCKAHAPYPAVMKDEGNFILVWPSTGAHDWCWEFEQAEE